MHLWMSYCLAGCRDEWGHRLETLYLQRKNLLDQVSCSMLRVQNQHLATELFHRLISNEASFDELSWKYAEGPEKQYAGKYKSRRLLELPAGMVSLLKNMKPGETLKPRRLGSWYVIIPTSRI